MMPVAAAGILLLLGSGVLYVVYRICFRQFRPGYADERIEYYTPSGEAYEPYREVIEKGIMADCGFSSPREILCSVMDRLKLPSRLMYPVAKLAAQLYGGFHLEEASAVESLRNSTIPVLLIHGEGDDVVPSWMSVKCHEVCASDCELLLVPGIGHGMAYCHGANEYEAAVERFLLKTLGIRPLL